MKLTKGRPAAGWVRWVLAAMALLAAACGLPRPGLAIDVFDIAKAAPQQDLARYLAGLQVDTRTIRIERPDSPAASRDQMRLTAAGPGPRFNWVAAGFANSGAERRVVVISIPQQGITASGFYPARLAGLRVIGTALEGDGSLEALQVPGENAFVLTMPPGGSATVAFEVTPGPVPASLWLRQAYDTHKDYLSFFRGALLGVSVLIALALFLLHGFRARAMFPVAGGFAVAAIGFLLFEAGHLTPLISYLSLPVLNMQVLRAVIEGLMTAFLILLLAQFSDVQRLSRATGTLLTLAAGLAFAIPLYGFVDPLLATAVARAAFAAAAALGFLLMLVLWWKGEVQAETAVISSGAILLWTLLAMLAAFSTNPGSSISAVVMVGLGAVLVILGFALAHHAFTQGYLSRHFFREAGRQTLALAGARAYVWDWQPDEGELFVSPEIGRALGQQMTFQEGVTGEAFLESIHPADRPAYLAAVEQATIDGRRPIERKFRLRHGDGSYRWFELKARSIAGRGLRAARCIGTLNDVTNSKIAEERLLQDAVYDRVTGLPNRALFVDRLERAIEKAGAIETSGLFVLIVDLDRFKMVNDAMGYEAGDALLSVIGRRLKAEAGQTDTVARLPGDQFAILFQEGGDDRDVASVAQALIKTVARPVRLDKREFFLTASIGIARAGEASQTAEELLKEAAVALYEARRQGAEAVALFSPDMVDDRAELVILESELRRAIERNEIEVHFQPIARLADMQLAGFEALVRWRHPGLGLLAPESFLGLAEETGIIRDIGRVVLNDAGRQLGIWQRAYRAAEPLFVAVNISSSQLIEPSLIEDIRQIIGRENVAHGSFKIEVTESLIMQYPERAQQILERFRALGVGLSCDDFGTGYSSLSTLRTLPFDTLKVDRNFIGPEAEDERGSVILQAIIDMGHELGLAIVAEGIETQEQVDRLGQLGCDYGQGYFIGQPLPAKQVSEALSGLPYARSSGRTAITWLWERSLKNPLPQPKLIRVTADDVPKPAPAPGGAAPAEAAEADQLLPPAPRQRKQQRRVSLLEDMAEEVSGAA